MPNDALADRYEFSFVGGRQNSYFFVTEHEVVYEIKFVPSGYLFESRPELVIQAFEMIISVVDKPITGRLPAGPLTAPTIHAIFYDFFHSKEQVIVFVCDSSDGRHTARARKFTSWFYTDIRPHMAKFDRAIPDGERIALISIILHDQHPNFADVLDVFYELGQDNK